MTTSRQSRTLYLRSSGARLAVSSANLLGSGGEGAVFAIESDPRRVAKIYHQPKPLIGSKLRLMVANPPTMTEDGEHPTIAWPLDTLHSSLPAGDDNTVGYVMRKLDGMKPLNRCFNPASRAREFPHFTYRHLCSIAINIAQAITRVHSRNYVMGDVNESNFMVNADGMISLVDTDSFQVIDEDTGHVHRSLVGKPEYTPAELQGRRFDSIDREQYHDRFSMAVLFFHLLMEGRHPFSGIYMGSGDPPPVEKNIAAGYFLYSENRRVPLRDGPGFLPWSVMDPGLTQVFRLCFESGHRNQIVRPTAFRWYEALASATRSLRACDRNPNHVYFPHSRTCPWCERTALMMGNDPFPPAEGPAAQRLGDGLESELSRAPKAPVAPRRAVPPRTRLNLSPNTPSRSTSFGPWATIRTFMTNHPGRAVLLMSMVTIPAVFTAFMLGTGMFGGETAVQPPLRVASTVEGPTPVPTATQTPPTPVPTRAPDIVVPGESPVDLRVERISYRGGTVSLNVVNTGTRALVTFATGLFIDEDTHPYSVVNHSEIIGLDPLTIRIPWEPPADRCHDLRAWVDMENGVRESNDANNLSGRLTVCPTSSGSPVPSDTPPDITDDSG